MPLRMWEEYSNEEEAERMFAGGGRYCQLLIALAAIFIVVAVSVIRYCPEEVNYRNSDATWHTLLTIEAYNETPARDHLFLPIVSLGEDEDKYIPWGATIPDEDGNYYYTSFSPAGYVVPWLFMKLFQLSVCEESLYLFNSVLFALSAVLWGIFIFWSFGSRKETIWLSVIGIFTYVLTPELLHGMGIVYWHQSLMQVTLLIQMMAFWRAKEWNSKPAKVIFYVFALLNPYIEWTGYVANVGFALAEMRIGRKGNLKKAFGRAAVLGLITISSFGVFAGHYLLKVSADSFLLALKNRFMARNITASLKLTSVFESYLPSFLFLWLLIVALVVWNIAKKKCLELRHGMLMLVMAFPVIENFIMKEHAVAYTYDKMKACFLLSFLVCELAYQLIHSSEHKKATAVIVSGLVAFAGTLNLNAYLCDRSYIWPTSYQEKNKQISAYINSNYPGCALGARAGASIRGYMNLLFGRGIYEGVNADALKRIADEKGERYAVILDIEGLEASGVHALESATIYDVWTDEVSKIIVDAGELVSMQLNSDGVLVRQASPLTDLNWTDGYSNTGNILLFAYDTDLLIHLLESTTVICAGQSFPIAGIDYDGQWIRVSIGADASVCKYPNYIQIE